MNGHTQEAGGRGFMIGLLAGTALGAGLTMFFAPKVRSEIRKRVAASAKDLGETASDYYEDVSSRVSDAVDDLASRGQKVRDVAADVVARGSHGIARGAREVERFAEVATKAAGR